jgi:putative tricarboxylic transport membrane protein
MKDENFRRTPFLSGGEPMVFVQRPISAPLFTITVILIAILIFPAIRRKREEMLQE